MSSIEAAEHRATDAVSRPNLRLVTTPPALAESSFVGGDEPPIELKLHFRELVLIHRALQVVRTLDLIERQDILLDDTIQVVDTALEQVV
jgi:hypothetical protein